jgi:anti-anti-sigma factor
MVEASRLVRGRILVSPREPLVGGGAAEALEQRLQQLLRAGHGSVVIDLSAVPSIDSSGIRALIRAHTTAQRLGCSVRLAAISAPVAKVLEASHLMDAFDVHRSVEAARFAAWPWRALSSTVGGIVLCGALVWIGVQWRTEFAGPATEGAFGQGGAVPLGSGPSWQPFFEIFKLAAATCIGLLITAVHRPASRDRQAARSMAHAQVLLCMAGALMMILIGNSIARAFGIAGAASIVRFRTPVDDPKDVTILFILMGLGMAAGLGGLAVAGLGAAFLCIVLLLMDAAAANQARLLFVEVTSEGRHFPFKAVEEVFLRNQIEFEPREITHGDDTEVKYHTWLDPGTSIEDLSAQMRNIAGVTEVTWEHPKRV